MVLDKFFDVLFYPFLHFLSPRWSLIGISLIITVLITLAYKFLTNQQRMKELKAEVKDLQAKMKESKEDKDKLMQLNQQAMGKNLEVMKHSLRPTLITFIPIIIIFSWLRNTYLPAGDLFSWNADIILFGSGIGWLWTYILCSFIFSLIIRKVLKIQ